MRISDWSSDVCSSDLLDQIGKRCAPANLIVFAVAHLPAITRGKVQPPGKWRRRTRARVKRIERKPGKTQRVAFDWGCVERKFTGYRFRQPGIEQGLSPDPLGLRPYPLVRDAVAARQDRKSVV